MKIRTICFLVTFAISLTMGSTAIDAEECICYDKYVANSTEEVNFGTIVQCGEWSCIGYKKTKILVPYECLTGPDLDPNDKKCKEKATVPADITFYKASCGDNIGECDFIVDRVLLGVKVKRNKCIDC